tara:strand:- start:460 stop:582 length:123 start_codon:yes stop_codon:yes gene_type:complete
MFFLLLLYTYLVLLLFHLLFLYADKKVVHLSLTLFRDTNS